MAKRPRGSFSEPSACGGEALERRSEQSGGGQDNRQHPDPALRPAFEVVPIEIEASGRITHQHGQDSFVSSHSPSLHSTHSPSLQIFEPLEYSKPANRQLFSSAILFSFPLRASRRLRAYVLLRDSPSRRLGTQGRTHPSRMFREKAAPLPPARRKPCNKNISPATPLFKGLEQSRRRPNK